MAEFVQTMKDWRRMCKDRRCDICRLKVNDICNCDPESWTDEDFIKIENTITEWAAENPEPVYPRWCDWLAEQGVLVCDNSFPNMRYWYAMNKEKMEQPIPADIAEKLGLQPKEG